MTQLQTKLKNTATYKTIISQPAEIRRLSTETSHLGLVEKAAALLQNVRRVFLVGTGTSFHAAQQGQFLLRKVGLEAWAVPAFDFALYPQPLNQDDAIIILSHRGTKLFTRQSLEKAQSMGATPLIITGQNSPLVTSGFLVLQTTAQELSSTHTASYVTALTVLIQIASKVAEKEGYSRLSCRLRQGLEEAAGELEGAIRQQGKIEIAARELGKEGTRLFIAGAGPAGITAAEGALKAKEAAYVTAEGGPLETFLHGPIVSLGTSDHLILLNSFKDGPVATRTAEVAQAAQKIGVKVWLIGQAPDGYKEPVWLDLGVPTGEESLASLIQVVPLQLLACFLAEVRGANPDSFRYDVPGYKAALSHITL